jgi:carboxyl-terminal processing protease
VNKNWVPITIKTTSFIVFFLVSVTNILTGCSGGTSLARVVGGLNSPFGYSQEYTPNYKRFKEVYTQLVADDLSRATQLRHFSDAYSRVRSEYVKLINDEKLIDSAIKGLRGIEAAPGTISSEDAIEAALDSMLGSLDPHSGYMNPQELIDSRASTSGQFGGLGIEIKMTDGLIQVISPMVDTPAYQAGLKSGDLITHVDGYSIKKMSLVAAVHRLRGKPGSDVRITVRRASVGTFLVTITRAIIKVKPVKWQIEGNIGVVRITRFNLRSLGALENAVKSIRLQLGGSLAGLVIDLRNNPGGLLNQSVAIADSFLNKGQIISVRDRDGEVRGFEAQKGDITGGLPIVVLINRGSASASEIVAGALQDHRRATLMGLRSFGKGSVQTISALDWGGALRLTTALYYLPSGRTIQGSGIDPDLVVLEKKKTTGKREADLPNALLTQGRIRKNLTNREILVEKCPSVGDKKKDKLLGCAVMFLNSGSQENFITLLNARKKL